MYRYSVYGNYIFHILILLLVLSITDSITPNYVQISETKIEVIVPIITSARTVNGHLETSPVSTTVIVPQQSRAELDIAHQ